MTKQKAGSSTPSSRTHWNQSVAQSVFAGWVRSWGMRQLTVIQQFKIDWGEPFNSILVAMEAAEKYFGDKNPRGGRWFGWLGGLEILEASRSERKWRRNVKFVVLLVSLGIYFIFSDHKHVQASRRMTISCDWSWLLNGALPGVPASKVITLSKAITPSFSFREPIKPLKTHKKHREPKFFQKQMSLASRASLAYCQLMAFDLDMISIGCVAPMDPVMKFTTRGLASQTSEGRTWISSDFQIFLFVPCCFRYVFCLYNDWLVWV